MTACLMHPFDRCVGVELLDSLYKSSVEMKAVYDNYVEESMASSPEASKMPKFEVNHGDLLEFDWWSEADLVLANSTCFEFNLMLEISERASKMKKGSWMITLTKKLPSADPIHERDPLKRDWECVLSIKMVMSWGYATVNI
jgi:hypothetical protein